MGKLQLICREREREKEKGGINSLTWKKKQRGRMRKWVWQHLNGTSGEFLSSSSIAGRRKVVANLRVEVQPDLQTCLRTCRTWAKSHRRWQRTWAIDPDGLSPRFPFTFFDLRLPLITHGLSAVGVSVGNQKTDRDCFANIKTLHISQDKTHGWKDGRSMFIEINPMVNFGGAWEALELRADRIILHLLCFLLCTFWRILCSVCFGYSLYVLEHSIYLSKKKKCGTLTPDKAPSHPYSTGNI